MALHDVTRSSVPRPAFPLYSILASLSCADRNAMDYEIIIFWLVCFSCLCGLAVTWTRVRFAAPGWIVLYVTILLISVTGWLLEQPPLIYTAAGMWFLLALLPGLILRLSQRRFMQQQFPASRRL